MKNRIYNYLLGLIITIVVGYIGIIVLNNAIDLKTLIAIFIFCIVLYEVKTFFTDSKKD